MGCHCERQTPACSKIPEYGHVLRHLLVYLESCARRAKQGVSPRQLEEAITRLKQGYYKREYTGLYETDPLILAYLCSYLPRTLVALVHVLSDLMQKGFIPHKPRILDLGSGCGTGALALYALLGSAASKRWELGEEEIRLPAEMVFVDHSQQALSLLQDMLQGLSEQWPMISLETDSKNLDLKDPEALSAIDGSFDLVLVSNLLTELTPSEAEALLKKALQLLGPRGSLLILETEKEGAKIHRLVHHLASQGYAEIAGPCFTRCQARECWLWHQVPMDLSFLPHDPLLYRGNRESRYTYFLLRRDSLAFNTPTGGPTLLDQATSTEVDLKLAFARVLPDLGLIRVCDGVSGSAWLKSPPGWEETPTGSLWRVQSETANWGMSYQGYTLSLGWEYSITPLPSPPLVRPSDRFYHRELGPITIWEMPGGCRDKAEVLIEQFRGLTTCNLGDLFDTLSLRRL